MKSKNEAFTKWLRLKFKERALTMRVVAAKLGLQTSQIWKILESQRKIQLREIPVLAELVGVSSQELMARMGIVVGGMDAELSASNIIAAATASKGKKGASSKPLKMPKVKVSSSRLVGWVDSDLKCHPKDLGSVTTPMGVGKDPLVAYRFQTMGGSGYQPFDGALAFVRHSGVDDVSADAFGRLCLVRTGSGLRALRVVGRGYQEGTYNLFGFDGSAKESAQALLSANPVILIKF